MEDVFYLRLVTSMASDLFEGMLQARLDGAGVPRDMKDAKSDAVQLVPRKYRRLVHAALRRTKRASISRQRAVDTCSLGRLIIDGRFLELGKRFAAKELLATPDDIFYLNLDEVRQIVAGGCAGNTCNNYRLRVAMRRRENVRVRGH